MNQDLKNYIWFIVCQGGRILFSAIGMALLARFLGPAGLGRWAMVTAAATLLHLVLINWIQQDPLLRFGREEWLVSHSIRHTFTARLPIMVSGIAIAGILFIAAPGAWIDHWFHLTHFERYLALAYFLSLVLSIEISTLLQINEQMQRLALAPALIAVASAMLYGILWRVAPTTHRLELALMGAIAVTIGVWAGISLEGLRNTPLVYRQWDSALAKRILIYAWPILPTAILGYCVNWGNQLLIQQSFSSRDVGLYQSAFQVHALVVALTIPFTTIIVPRLIGKHIEDPSIMKRYVNTIAPTLTCLWFLAAVPMVAILPWTYRIVFGRGFLDSVSVLMAFLVSTPLCALGQIYTVLYTVQGRMGKIFWILALMAAVDLLTAWVLFPNHGLVMIALAFSASFVLSQCLTVFYQHYVLGEPAGGMAVLITTVLLFSIAQLGLHSLGARLLWAIAALGGLVGVVRQIKIIDRGVLQRLFTGRLAPVGLQLEHWLISGRAGV